ncbi:ATP-dependent zinc protease [Halomonas sp. GXIMD04776]|uniref:retropepsin-like aspartic peptidase RloA3 n=1 Tax=Halomonas sp. GXIMD04776 TaxID=3415605 RepID=UPI003CA130FD
MRNLTRHVALPTLLTALLMGTAWADDDDTYGWIEKAGIGSLGAVAKAKLDSGALTSSINAKDIERFERDGEDWVRFTLNLEDQESEERVAEEMELPLHRDLTVRGAGGKDERPVVLLKICMGKTIYEEQFSLRDRSDMLYPVLLGRRTIQHLGKLDVTRTFLQEPKCDEDSPVRTFAEQDTDGDIGA